MSAPDLEVIKEIPGYKVILKAVLKAQIQQLVEQLAAHTDEESVILTASVSDGTLCHLGSESGKVFLEDHDDIKSQFLGFCLKRHHRKKQKEKEEAVQRSVPTTPTRMGPSFGPRPGASRPSTSPRHQFSPTRFQGSPRQGFPQGQGPHPVSLSRASHQSGPVRSSPYPQNRPIRRPNFEQGAGGPRPAKQPMKLPVASGNGKVHKMNLSSSEVIKIEAIDDDADDGDKTAQGDSTSGIKISSVSGAEGVAGPGAPDSSPSSPSHTPSIPQPSDSVVKDDSSEKKSSDSSSSTIPNEPSDMKLPEGLSLDSDLSNLISESDAGNASMDSNIPPGTPQSSDSNSELPTPGASSDDPNVNVKIEAITESEMDLEITGVEPGMSAEWSQNVQNRMAFAAGGSQGAMPDDQAEGYSPSVTTKNARSAYLHSGELCTELEQMSSLLHLPSSAKSTDMAEVDGQHLSLMDTPAVDSSGACNHWCDVCGKPFQFRSRLLSHYRSHSGDKPHKCPYCDFRCSRKDNLKLHILTHLHVSR